MLQGISPLLSPELLKVLCEMGHGDEIVLADANFPAESLSRTTTYGNAIRADGMRIPALLEAILPLFPLDQYDRGHFVLMEVVPGDSIQPVIWREYEQLAKREEPNVNIAYLERFAFYDRARSAYAIIATGETAQYANIILKKGVVR